MTFLLAPLLMLGPWVIGLATHTPTELEERIAGMRDDDAEIRRLPAVHANRISDVLSATLEDNLISLHAINKWTEPDVQVILPKMRGTLRVGVFNADDPNRKYPSFRLLRHDPRDPIYGDKFLDASVAGPQSSMAWMSENASGSWTVQFIQNPGSDPVVSGDEVISLDIQRTDEINADRSFHLRLTARDMAQLRRDHPKEVDLYFRPLARALDQEPALFAISPAAAWQAVGNDRVVDPGLKAKIAGLLKAADAEGYAERQSAIDALKTLGADAQPILQQWDRATLDVQQNSVLDSLLADAPTPTTGPAGVSNDISVLLDVLFIDDARLKQRTVSRLAQLTGQKIDLSDARDAAAVQKLRDRLQPATMPSE